MLDVAQRAGVSKASVSRFIGEDRALLYEATAQRRPPLTRDELNPSQYGVSLFIQHINETCFRG